MRGVFKSKPSIAPGGQRPDRVTGYAHAVTNQIAAAASLDPVLATVIISPRASRIRDGRTRAKIARRTAEALGGQIDGDPFPVASLDARIRPGALSVLRR